MSSIKVSARHGMAGEMLNRDAFLVTEFQLGEGPSPAIEKLDSNRLSDYKVKKVSGKQASFRQSDCSEE